MHMKNVAKMAFAAMTAVLLLAACGTGGNSQSGSGKVDVKTTGFPIVSKNLKMTMIAPSTGAAKWDDMAVLKDYAKKTNVTLKYNTPPMSDFSTKLNLAFASQDLPDIIYAASSDNLTATKEVTYGTNGQLLPLEKLIPKYAPNFNALMKKNPDIRRSITAPDGHIYALPMVAVNAYASWQNNPMWYNGAWLKKLGIKELPKTTDEFYDLLMKFKNDDPNGNGKQDEIPLSDTKLASIRTWLMAAFGLLTQDVQNDGNKVFYTPITTQYKAYLTYMHKLYANGLLDKDTFAQSDDQRKAKGQSNRLGVYADYFSYFTSGKTPNQAVEDPMWQPLTSPESTKAVVPLNNGLNRGNFALTKNNPSPAASLRWVDYFYSKKGSDYLNNGPEGVYWVYAKNKEGKKVRVLAKGINESNSEDKRSKITPDYGLTTPSLVFDNDSDPVLVSANAPTGGGLNAFLRKETKDKILPYAKQGFPMVYLTSSEQDSISSITNDLKTYVEQSEAKFITGVTPLSDWDKYVSTIKGMHVDQYVKVYQAAYDRWKNAK